MKAVVMDLLRQYLRVETQFQNGKPLPEDYLRKFPCRAAQQLSQFVLSLTLNR